ncbi:hypothetical protein BGZ94_007502 [Podila epigama]|nr:hypothetical protein BGZ94_007502 [Podila epigama]
MPGSGDRKPSVAAGGSRRKPSQSNSNSGQTSPAIPSSTGSKSTVKHIPVNTFNSQDVNNHFQNSWTAALENFHRAGTTGAGSNKEV